MFAILVNLLAAAEPATGAQNTSELVAIGGVVASLFLGLFTAYNQLYVSRSTARSGQKELELKAMSTMSDELREWIEMTTNSQREQIEYLRQQLRLRDETIARLRGELKEKDPDREDTQQGGMTWPPNRNNFPPEGGDYGQYGRW